MFHQNTNGDGSSWNAVTVHDSGTIIYGLATGDLNGDDDADIAAAGSAQKFYDYKDTSGGSGSTWNTNSWSSRPDLVKSTAIGDIDGDGDKDIVTGDTGGKIYWYENSDGAGGSWTRYTVMSLSGTIYSVEIGDLDGDGDMDIVSGDSYDDVYVHINQGSGTSWNSIKAFDDNKDIYTVAVADVDGDGDRDVVAGGQKKKVYLISNTNGQGTSWTKTDIAPSLAGYVKSVSVTDVDDDGDLDVVSGDESNKVILHTNNGGSWSATTLYTASDKVYSVVAADVDCDGDGDVLSGGRDNKITFIKNDGSWTSSTVWTAPSIIYGLAGT